MGLIEGRTWSISMQNPSKLGGSVPQNPRVVLNWNRGDLRLRAFVSCEIPNFGGGFHAKASKLGAGLG